MASISIDRNGFLANVFLARKGPCRAGTTAAITLSGEQTIDGVAVVAEDRVLVKNQSSAIDNGVYICKTAEWERAQDLNQRGHADKGTTVLVTDGTANALTEWVVTTSGDPVPGQEAISFSLYSNSTLAALVATRGDIIRGGASDWEVLALGTSGYHLQSNGTDVVWSGTLKADDGTVSAPSITFISDPDTGLYRVGANSLGIAAAGDQQVRFFSQDGTSGGITQPRVGGLWTNAANFRPTPVTGVNIARFERVFVGAACDNDGTQVPTGAGADWLETADQFTTSNAELAVVAQSGRNAFVCAVRSSDNETTPSNNIAASIYAYNNNTTQSQSTYGAYIEVERAATAGSVIGLEIGVKDAGTAVDIRPYNFDTGGAVSAALWLEAGAEETSNDCTLAIAILNNNAKYKRGIVFAQDALTGSDGSTGTAEAICMAKGHEVDWYFDDTSVGAVIRSDVGTANDKQLLLFTSTGAEFQNAGGNRTFLVTKVAGTLTGNLAVVASTAGTPSLIAEGSATNIPIGITGKGTGGVNITGTSTNDSAAAGIVGQIIESSVGAGSAVSLTTATAADVTSISLTAGDWDVWGSVWFTPGATTNITEWLGAINTTSATVPSSPNAGAFYKQIFTGSVPGQVPNGTIGQPVGTMRISVASTTTVYLVARANFTVSTLGGYGYIGARRVR